jgi:GMP synthase-like glutamine amidotransferase
MKFIILQHIPYESPGSIIDWLIQNAHTYEVIHLYERHALPKPNTFDCLIIMGGPMSANDGHQHKWLNDELTFIKKCIQEKKKVIGICLGSQLIAKVLEANVYENPVKEIGFFPITKTFSAYRHPVLEKLPDTWDVFHWHSETFDLPEGATRLYASKACKNQFYIVANCIGIQFHPEINLILRDEMIKHGERELNERLYVQSKQQMLNAATDLAILKAQCFQLLDNVMKL